MVVYRRRGELGAKESQSVSSKGVRETASLD